MVFKGNVYILLISDKSMEERIIVNPRVLVGKPTIRGTRIPVYLILNLLANGKTIDDILNEYPELTREDILAAIKYAAMHMGYETKQLETAR